MDKARDVRCEGSSGIRFSKSANNKQYASVSVSVSVGHKFSHGSNGVQGDLQFSEKSKKEKLRSLSVVGKAISRNQQQHKMGVHLSQKRDASPSSAVATTKKRFKNPKKKSKVFKDCDGVDHASVPRKIRSAMKKRCHESFSNDSEKVSHKISGIESPEKDGIKNSKKRASLGWSTGQAVSGPITKDEEEVVETLYALAGMFPENCSNGMRELECESLMVLQNPEESANATNEGPGNTQNASPCPERSPRGPGNSSLKESVVEEQTGFPEKAKFLEAASHGTAPKINEQAMHVVAQSENARKDSLQDESDLCLTMGLNMPRQSHISNIGNNPDAEFEIAGGIDCEQEQHVIKNQKENGLALWPDLSSRVSAGVNVSYLKTSPPKAPDWHNVANYASKQDFTKRSSSGRQISKDVIHKKPWKRCAAHVHISHLIQSLEVPERQATKEPQRYECQQTSEHQGSKRGVRTEVQNSNGMRIGISSTATTDISLSPPTPTPMVNGPQKQSFNFLSMSAGANGLKINDNMNKVGSMLEQLPKLQVPYFQSQQQQHGLMPIPMSQSPQVRLHPHYYGNPLRGTHYSSTVSNRQQDQSFWAMQAQGSRSAVNINIMRAQYPNWRGGSHDSYAAIPCVQGMHPRPSTPLGSQITSISEQQLFALASSLPKSRTNGLDIIHIPSVCEESKGRFRSSGTQSLQLLCGERI